MAAAAASPRALGPQPWTAHGICLTCGLRCYSNQSLRGHSYMWLADADSCKKYSFYIVSLKKNCNFVCFHAFVDVPSVVVLLCCGSGKSYRGCLRVGWYKLPGSCCLALPAPGTPHSHFRLSLTSLELHFVRASFYSNTLSNKYNSFKLYIM